MRSHGDIFINLKSLSITILTFYMLTASLYIAIFNSLSIQILILGSILSILIFNEVIIGKGLALKKTDVFFIIAMFAVIGSLHKFTLTTSEFADPVVISLGILITILIRGDINNFNNSMKLIKIGGVFYALSVMLSYFFPNIYYTLFLSHIRPVVAENILMSMANGYSTGFTGQVAYTAGYIVSAIGLIYCGWITNNRKLSKKEKISFIILLLGLLFTQKRAHLLFMLLSLFIVYIQFSGYFILKIKKTFKVLLFIILIIIPFLIVISLTSIGQLLFTRIFETFYEFSNGEDITSNRISLWMHAWETFLQNPILGIGWGNFRESVVGNVTFYTEMEAHNIYLQLLSETGIVGTVFILFPFFITYVYTIKLTRLVSENKHKYSSKWDFAVPYSLYIQTFFLLYGLTGNSLYDYSFLVMYFLSFGLIYSFWQNIKQSEST